MRTQSRAVAVAALVVAVLAAIVASAALASTFDGSSAKAQSSACAGPHLALRGPQPPRC